MAPYPPAGPPKHPWDTVERLEEGGGFLQEAGDFPGLSSYGRQSSAPPPSALACSTTSLARATRSCRARPSKTSRRRLRLHKGERYPLNKSPHVVFTLPRPPKDDTQTPQDPCRRSHSGMRSSEHLRHPHHCSRLPQVKFPRILKTRLPYLVSQNPDVVVPPSEERSLVATLKVLELS